jgi:hypothetical protein
MISLFYPLMFIDQMFMSSLIFLIQIFLKICLQFGISKSEDFIEIMLLFLESFDESIDEKIKFGRMLG